MKNYIVSTIAATGLIIFILGMDCTAQSLSRVTAEVPFDFYVGSELLPKGKYEFESANRQATPSSIIIRSLNSSGRGSLIVPAIAGGVQPHDAGFKLIFNRYGTVHYLSTIHSNVGGGSMKLARTSTEKQLARQYEKTSPVTIKPNDVAGN